MWVATSGVKSGNCFSCFCSFAFWRIFHAAWRCVSLCFCRNVNHKAKAHLWPLRIPATPCRFSWPAEKATARPHSGFSLAWKLTSVCSLDWMSEFLSLRPLYLWQVYWFATTLLKSVVRDYSANYLCFLFKTKITQKTAVKLLYTCTDSSGLAKRNSPPVKSPFRYNKALQQIWHKNVN